jgi:hypothetical protein
MAVARDDKMDPVLEIWVEDDRSPVLVRLVGTLDQTTSASLLSVMNDLFTEGCRQLLVDLAGADIAASGGTTLAVCQRRARESGGSLLWDGVHFGPPVAAVANGEVMVAC